jgi:quaternary ammonium compound-resistance protein SugE
MPFRSDLFNLCGFTEFAATINCHKSTLDAHNQYLTLHKSTTMPWLTLVVAGLFEVIFAACLAQAKVSTGSKSFMWYGFFLVALTASMVLLVRATQSLPIGTAYAVWTGIGAVGTALVGIVFFKDPLTFWRLFFITTLIGSIVGLKAVS